MSTALDATFPLGPVQCYWNRVRLGSPKSQATIRHNKETVQTRFEDTGQSMQSKKIAETCEVDIVLADFKASQMRYVYDQAASFASKGTLSSVPYTASNSTVFRYREEQKLSGTAPVTLGAGSFDTSTITVSKTDWSTEYTQGTDFTATPGTGALARISGGAITDGQTVYVEYDEAANANFIATGGLLHDFEAELKLVLILTNGKLLQFVGYRAKKIGASDVAIAMAAEFAGVPMTFHMLADATKAPGKQLCEWSVEV